MKSRGFTLIELLAIIVILAIISVITMPIILNIIENSKKGAIQDSALGYKDSINKFYVSKLSEKNNYSIPDKIYTVSQLKSLGVIVNGQEPIGNSWIRIEKNNVIGGCLQFDEYKTDITNGEVGNTEKGNCEKPGPTYIQPTETDTHKGIVYLDPTNINNTCNEKIESQNRNKNDSVVNIKTGCMKWYLYSESNLDLNNDGTITEEEKFYNLILDHNTSLSIEWTKYKENNQYVNYKGPREALYQLYEDTKDWTGIKDLTSTSNYTATWQKNGDQTYTIDYTKHLTRTSGESGYTYALVDGAHKARFITAEEVAEATGGENWTINSNYFFLDHGLNGRTASNPSNYAWLYENLNECVRTGCKKESSNLLGNNGYWTASAAASMYTNKAWIIESGGRNYIDSMERTSFGIRPVITIEKSLLEI